MSTRGTLHPSPLKLTPSSVFLSFDHFPRILSHLFFFSSLHLWTLRILWYFSSLHHLRPAIICTRFRCSPKFLSNSCSKIVIQLNTCHKLFCIVIICNFWCSFMPWYPIIFIMQIKHDYYHFPLVLSPTFFSIRWSSTWGTIFHLKQCNSLLEMSFNMFLCSLCFSKLPLSFFFLLWSGLTIILRLLSSVTSDSVLSFQMSQFLPRSFATPYS